MITSELVAYIEKEIKKNVPKDLIISKLVSVGWHQEDIDLGFSSLETKTEGGSPQNKVWIPRMIPVIKEEIKEIPIIEVSKIKKEEVHEELEIVSQPKELEAPEIKEELIPTLIPKNKMVVNSIDSIIKDNLVKEEAEPEIKLLDKTIERRNSLVENLPKSAMLSSYDRDLSSVNKEEKQPVIKKGRKIFKWLILILVILFAGVVFWVFKSGYINIKDFNLPFIKKDPKVLLLNNSKVLALLNSYKTEMNIEILSPSFSDISAGLVSGSAINLPETDSISIKTNGLINNNGEKIISDNTINIKGSILSDQIITNIKNNGTELFISVPDLSSAIKEIIPESTIIRINKDQFDLIPYLFSDKTKLQLKKINFNNLLSSGITSYLNNDTLSIYDEFIKGASVIEKDQENIKGIDTYHYVINPDRQLAKKLIAKISDKFILNLSDEDKNTLDSIIGSVTINSFDVWVGKGDNNIYQYRVSLDVPLSKIIGFEDKSIGDNKINFSLQSTYFDFNIPNEILIPENFTLMNNFVNEINQEKIKKEVSSFGPLTNLFYKTVKTYGNKSNGSGSCMNPTSGSIFSPIGHPKSAIDVVSSISLLLNKVMGTTNGAGFCFSTPSAWSLSIPISNNYDLSSIPTDNEQHYFCVDSKGSSKELIIPPTSIVCE